MAVVQMQRVGICALNKHRKKILESLQKQGVMEIDFNVDSEKEFSRADTANVRSSINKNISQSEKALEIIDEYAPVKKSALASLQGKPFMEQDIYDFGAQNEKKLDNVIDRLIEIDRDIVALNANISKLNNQIEELVPWQDLSVAMEPSSTKCTDFFVGTIAGEVTERDIEAAVSQKSPELDCYSIVKISGSKDMSYFAVVVLKSQTKELEDCLRHMGFARPSYVPSKTPQEMTESMKKEIEDNEKEIVSLTDEISKLSENYKDIQSYSDYCRLRAGKYEVLGNIPQTKNVFAVEGYVPVAMIPALQAELDKYDAIIETRDIEKEEEAPVLFKNGWLGSIGEGTVESFGLPNKKEIDPSTIMMVFYIIFFGLMLSDAAYGAVLSICTGIALLKFPRMEKGMKNLIQLFFLCGFSTLFWGVMFGGYFGDVVDVVARTFLGVDLPAGQSIIPAVWFVPINDPMRMLVYSLLFGIIHMFVGLFLAAYQNIKNKEITALITTISTGLFILGLILILLPTDLFQSIAQTEFNFSPGMQSFSKVITIVGLVGIILFSSADTKNPALRVLLGLYEVYNDITGWLSDTLSYSRLLALGLATGVIAQVFNQLGSMFGGGVVGAILFIVIFIVGHVFNLAINVLGAYVHTCRLQYVEFFGKFYEGGGVKFSPFFADTKYVEIKGGK